MEIITIAQKRKTVVKAVEEYFGEHSIYLGPPTFAYQVGCATVDRDGKVSVEDAERGGEVRMMLVQKGMAEGSAEDFGESSTTVKIPLEGMEGQGITNLINMLHSKQYLINKAIGAEGFQVGTAVVEALEKEKPDTLEEALSLLTGFAERIKGIEFGEGCVLFTGFPFSQEPDKVRAYVELAAMMVSHSKGHQRISAKATIEENEKYYMRVWLVRIGLGGTGGKETRMELLRNLKGHTAFRTEEERIKWQERQKAKRNAERTDDV